MANFKNAYFDFKVKPEDSKFLKAWVDLKNDPEFIRDFDRIKRKVEEERKPHFEPSQHFEILEQVSKIKLESNTLYYKTDNNYRQLVQSVINLDVLDVIGITTSKAVLSALMLKNQKHTSNEKMSQDKFKYRSDINRESDIELSSRELTSLNSYKLAV